MKQTTDKKAVMADSSKSNHSADSVPACDTRYRRMFENAREGILILDAETRTITDANRYMVDLLGFSLEEFIGKELWEIGLLADKAASQAVFSDLQANKYFRYADLSLETKGGIGREVEFIGCLYDDDGAPFVQCNVVETTKSKQVEEAALRLSALVNSSDDAIVSKTLDGIITSWNPGATRMFGYTADEAIGQPMAMLFPPDLIDQEADILARIGRGETVKHFDTIRIRKDETTINVSVTISPVTDNDGRIIGASNIARDITDRKQAEERLIGMKDDLQAAVNGYERMLDNSLDMICSVDGEGRFTAISSASINIFGYEPQELVGKLYMDLVHPDDHGITAEIAADIMAGKAVTNFENRYLHKDGRVIPVMWSSKWLESEKTMFAVARDITERKRDEWERTRLAGLLEQSLNEIYIFSTDTLCFEYVNASAQRNLGYGLDQMLTMTPVDIKPEFSEALFRDKVGPLLRRETDLLTCQTVHQRADGTHYNVEVHLQLSGPPDQQAFLAMTLDITERKLAEEALRASDEQLRFILTSSKIGYWDLDMTSNRTERTLHHDQCFGYSEMLPEWTYDTFLAHIHPDDRERVDQAFSKAAVGDGKYDVDFRVIWPDQSVHWLQSIGRFVHDESGKVLRASGLVIDVNDRKVAEIEIQMFNEELEQRVLNRTAQLNAVNQELEAFSYSVSHDLRAPLRHVNGFSLALLEDYSDQLDDAGKKYLNEIRGASREMDTLIDDLLNLSRVTRSTLKRESIDLSEIARRVVDDLQTASPDRRVAFSIEDGMTAVGDWNLLQVILVNLIGNAWKFTSKVESAEIAIGSEIRGDEIEYFVRDNGAGFDMAYANKLFGAFQRLHSGAAFEGTGIGLATVKRIINRHGGTVRAVGAVGKGATFYFTLSTQNEDQDGD